LTSPPPGSPTPRSRACRMRDGTVSLPAVAVGVA
jgi:hypothetical protein